MADIITDVQNINFGQSLSNIVSDINQFVVAPLAAFGIGGFVFNAEGEAREELSADITDHYAEDNKAIQDQVAIRPRRVTLKGYVGEVIYNGPTNPTSPIQNLAQKLTAITAFAPQLTAAATQTQQAIANPIATDFTGLLGNASNIYGLVKNALGSFGPTQNQQNAFNYFKALWQTSTLMGIQTPWEFITNMVIESVIAVQPEESRWITDFSVTFKEMRFAQTTTTSLNTASNQTGVPGVAGVQSLAPILEQSIAGPQQSPITNLGNNAGAVIDFDLNGSSFQ